jgi:hypothetical protein
MDHRFQVRDPLWASEFSIHTVELTSDHLLNSVFFIPLQARGP